MARNYSTIEVVQIARNPGAHTADVQKDVGKRYALLALRANDVDGLLAIIAAIPASTSTRTIQNNIENGVVESPQEAEENEPTGDEIEKEEIEQVDSGETEAEAKKRVANAKRNAKRKEKRDAEKLKKAEVAAVAPDEPDEPDDVDFAVEDAGVFGNAAEMSSDELKEACKHFGIKLKSGMTRADAEKGVTKAQAAAASEDEPVVTDWNL